MRASSRKSGRSRRTALGKLLDEPQSSKAATMIFIVIILAILTSVATFYLTSVPSLTAPDGGFALHTAEAVCVYIFTVELAVRTLVATLDIRRLLLLDPYWWIDLLSIVPFYVEMAILNQQACDPTSAAASASASANASLSAVVASIACQPTELPPAVRAMQLLRLLRILKLMRHYVDMRVLMIALSSAGRALLVPGFAMAMCILLLSGALWLAEGAPGTDETDAFDDAFEALWCVFWIVSTMGYEGRYGTGGGWGQLIIAAAVICGLILTTMPITFIGEAFSRAWNRRELLILEMRVQDELVRRGISVHDFKLLFDELDEDGSGELEWSEFKSALGQLGIRLPVQKMRELFESVRTHALGSPGT